MSWLVGNLLVASLLVAAVLVIRRPVARLFGPRAAYALWLAPALRLIMPPLPQLIDSPPVVAGGEAVRWMLITGERAAPAAGLPLLLIAWAVGAGLVLGHYLLAHHRFLARALAEGQQFEALDVSIDIVATPAVDGPVATGLFYPLILVPADFVARFTSEQQQFALWHEQLHHRRGDLWASAAALVAAALLWFNPLAYLALGAFRRDMESACDAALLARAGRTAAPAYAETILRCAARPVPRSLCALTSIDELKGRLTMLNMNHGMMRKAAGMMLAGGLVVGGLIATPVLAEESRTRTVEIRKVIHDGDGEHEGADIESKCPGEVVEVSAGGTGGADRKEVAKIKLCVKAGQSKADRAASLERVIADLDKGDEMDAGVKAELKAKLLARIAELRAGN